MSYMIELQARLEKLLTGIPEKDIIIREMKAIVLQSYKNGQKAGPESKRPTTRRTATPAA